MKSLKEFKRNAGRERDEGKGRVDGVDTHRVIGVDSYRVTGVDTYRVIFKDIQRVDNVIYLYNLIILKKCSGTKLQLLIRITITISQEVSLQ